MLDRLESVKLEHILRSTNKMVHVLTYLVAPSVLEAKENTTILVYGQWIIGLPRDK